jgi:hypothetical protein
VQPHVGIASIYYAATLIIIIIIVSFSSPGER